MLLDAQILEGDKDEPPQRVTGLWWCLRYSLMNGFVPPKSQTGARVCLSRRHSAEMLGIWLRWKPT